MVRTKRRASKNAIDKINVALSNTDEIDNNSTNETVTIDDNEPEYLPDKNNEKNDDENSDCYEGPPKKKRGRKTNIITAEDASYNKTIKIKRNLKTKEAVCNIVTWSVRQRHQFLEGFKDCFHDKWLNDEPPSDENIEKISSYVKGRSKEEVRKYFNYYLRRVVFFIKRDNLPIDKWLEACSAITPNNEILEQQMGTTFAIAGHETIEKSPEEKAGTSNRSDPNLKANMTSLYKYIGCALADKPLPELSPVDSLIIEDCMQSLIQQIISLRNCDLKDSLKRIYLHILKHPDHEQEIDFEEVESNLLFNASIYNPLGINPDSIIITPNDKP